MENCNIEVEVRSFVTDDQYKNLLSRLNVNAELIKETNEETIYFSGDKDLRLRKDENSACIILKKGELHDNHREEFEIRINIEDFENTQKLFESLGYEIEIKWLRKRLEFKQDDVKILLDNTKGYGKIIEIEKMVSLGEEDETYTKLTKRLSKLVDKISTKKEFDYAFEYYKKNWKTLIK
ncbi:MAG: CYTH domain-containing protein [Candidatus Pacebacteria bacterium]|nr:CYTH domain-containing protein [Candidatus Paceibacterota bacterium]